MADAKISALSAIAAIAGEDLLAVVDDPSGTPATTKATVTQIRAYLIGLATTWTATQTITPAANTNAIAVTGYSLTGSNAQSLIDLAGTWNTSGTPTALKLNVTDTASNAASLLLDVQVGGTSRLKLTKGGNLVFTNTAKESVIVPGDRSFKFSFDGLPTVGGNLVGLGLTSSSALYWTNSATDPVASADLSVTRDAADILALKRSTNAQTYRVYGTFTDASNYRRLAIGSSTGGTFTIAPQGAGTGASGNVLHISGLPASNPGAGILWNDAGTVKVGT